MALHYFPSRSVSPVHDADDEGIGFDLWNERAITAVATVLAVLVVAAIALLIGMA